MFPDGAGAHPGGPGPEVVAHRGASSEVAEHTLGAYLRAIEAGADAVECDVRLTADGHLVCVHDRRVDRTSTGTGRVSALELAHLEGLDWASWRDGEGGGAAGDDEVPDRDRGRILTLNRLLAAVADSGREVRVAVETKHPTRWGGAVERTLLEVLDRYGWTRPPDPEGSRVRVMSFSTAALLRVRRAAPSLPLVQLVDRVPPHLLDGRLPRGVGACGVSVRTLRQDPRWVRRVLRRGAALHAWTVDGPRDLALALERGASTVITNRPADVLGLLGRGPHPAVSPRGGAGSRGAVTGRGAAPRGRGAPP